MVPGAFALAVAAVDPEVARFYLVDWLGAGCFGSSLVLGWSGWWWMHRSATRAVGDLL